jgi:hypothetical protein
MIFLEPEFYDIFGIFVFIFLIWFGLRRLKNKKIKKWTIKIIIGIGIVGLCVDLFFVFRRFFH